MSAKPVDLVAAALGGYPCHCGPYAHFPECNKGLWVYNPKDAIKPYPTTPPPQHPIRVNPKKAIQAQRRRDYTGPMLVRLSAGSYLWSPDSTTGFRDISPEEGERLWHQGKAAKHPIVAPPMDEYADPKALIPIPPRPLHLPK